MKLKVLIIEKEPEMLYRPIGFLEKVHEVQIVKKQEGLINFSKAREEGLDYYDIIFMEPYFPQYPNYTYEETDDATQTGWFLYKDYLKDLKTAKIVIWTHPVEQYTYNENHYPERRWGPNVVGIRKKSSDDDSLINLVKEYCMKTKSKKSKKNYFKKNQVVTTDELKKAGWKFRNNLFKTCQVWEKPSDDNEKFKFDMHLVWESKDSTIYIAPYRHSPHP